MLVRHKEDAEHLAGTYGLPAGRIRENENSIDAAVRELKEETGLKTSTESLLELPQLYYATIERKDGSRQNFSFRVYLCKKYSGELQENKETVPEWINVSELKNYNLLPNVETAINDALKLNNKLQILNPKY